MGSYDVLRSERGPNEGFVLIGTTSSTYSTFLDYNVVISKDYWYRIRSVVSGETVLSGPFHVKSIGRVVNYPPVIDSTPVTSAREAVLYQYDVNAHDPEGGAVTYILDQAPTGMTINAATGLIAWTPGKNQAGPNDIAVRVEDALGVSGTQFFQIIVAPRPNTAPVANPGGPYSGLTGQVITFNGSGSTDPEGDPIVNYHWVFGDGTEDHGVQVTHTYTTASLYTVTLYVTDDRGGTGRAETTCQIDRPNQPPTADISGPSLGHVWAVIAFDGSGSYDPDGDTLTYTWNFGDSTPPATGETATHIFSAEGTYHVSLSVDDGHGGLGTASTDITIGPANEPPVVEFTGNTFGNVGDVFTFDGSSSNDPDGSIVSYEWDFNDGATTTGAIVTHVFNTPGHYTVTLKATDDDGAPDTYPLSVHINAPPEIASTPAGITNEDSLYTYDVEATDADGDTLTYSLTAFPSGMSIDSASGLIQWTPVQAQVGNNAVTVEVSDDKGRVTPQSFTISVLNVNDAPLITSSAVTSAMEKTLYVYDVEAVDEDGDVISYSLDSAPSGMSIDSATGLIQWTPAQAHVGEQSVTVKASDGLGGEGTQSFTIAVANFNDPPHITSTPPSGTAQEDAAYIYDVEAVDDDGDALTYALGAAPAGMTIDSRHWDHSVDAASVGCRPAYGYGCGK